MANRQYQDYTSHLARKRKATENRVVEELVTGKKRAEPPVTVDISDDYDEENDSSDTDEFSTVYGDEASKDKDEQEELATADKHSKKWAKKRTATTRKAKSSKNAKKQSTAKAIKSRVKDQQFDGDQELIKALLGSSSGRSVEDEILLQKNNRARLDSETEDRKAANQLARDQAMWEAMANRR